MDFSQIPVNPYAGQELMAVDAAHGQGMIDPNMLPNPYVPPPVSWKLFEVCIILYHHFVVVTILGHIF